MIKNESKLDELIKSRNQRLKDIGITEKNNGISNGLILFDCNASNPRLIAQQGLFSIPKSITGDSASKEINDNCTLCKLFFSESEREQMLAFLENMNYTTLRLFPDLQNICHFITDKNMKSFLKSKSSEI